MIKKIFQEKLGCSTELRLFFCKGIRDHLGNIGCVFATIFLISQTQNQNTITSSSTFGKKGILYTLFSFCAFLSPENQTIDFIPNKIHPKQIRVWMDWSHHQPTLGSTGESLLQHRDGVSNLKLVPTDFFRWFFGREASRLQQVPKKQNEVEQKWVVKSWIVEWIATPIQNTHVSKTYLCCDVLSTTGFVKNGCGIWPETSGTSRVVSWISWYLGDTTTTKLVILLMLQKCGEKPRGMY